MPNIVLIAESEVIRIDCRIVCQGKKVCTDALARSLSDLGFFKVSPREPLDFRYRAIVRPII